MQTDWLEKELQLNVTIITFKEVVNGYDSFSTIFLMLLQKVKVTFILSHLRKPFSICVTNVPTLSMKVISFPGSIDRNTRERPLNRYHVIHTRQANSKYSTQPQAHVYNH